MKKLFLLYVLFFSTMFRLNAQVVGECSNYNMEVQLVRCMRAGDKCIVDIIAKNVGPKDLTFGIMHCNCNLYDDMGGRCVFLGQKIGNMEGTTWSGIFPSGVPMKVRLEFEGISAACTSVARLDWEIKLDGEPAVSKFMSIPISSGKSTASNVASASASGETTLVEDVEDLANSVNELVNLFRKKKK